MLYRVRWIIFRLFRNGGYGSWARSDLVGVIFVEFRRILLGGLELLGWVLDFWGWCVRRFLEY